MQRLMADSSSSSSNSSSSENAPHASIACVVCGTPMQPKWSAMARSFELLACEGCGTLRTWPDLSDDEVAAHYPPSYYGEGNKRFVEALERVIGMIHKRRAADIAKRTTPGHVLDVGCGRGITLASMRDLGFHPVGVELSDTSARHARGVLGLDVRTSMFDDDLPRGEFTCVIFWHSLEHIRDPARAVARAHELLRPGGLLVVAVPNSESVQAKLFREKWFHLDVPRHYHHFSLRGVQQLVERHGFSVEATRHLNLEQNPYGVMQSAMNRLGFNENFLYSMLKQPSARAHNLREHPAQAALTALLAPVAGITGLAMALGEAAVRRGGTIDVFARKR